MAIDLCNKGNLLQGFAAGARGGGFHSVTFDTGASGIGAIPFRDLTAKQQDTYSIQTNARAAVVDPRYFAGDPATWASDFGFAVDRIAVRLDSRSSESLRETALKDPDPVMREQALYEYADRNEADAIELLTQVVRNDKDRELRWDALWAIEKLGGLSGWDALSQFGRDFDPEIAEWSSLFASELTTGDPAFDKRGYSFTKGRTFDETIYLLIHCDLYVRLDPNNKLWGKLSLGPQALARVYGQAHACPNVATRERQLVIAKQIDGLHKDGSPHIDNYLFRGFTERTQPDRGNFYFESAVKRPYFISGRADDGSKGVEDVTISFMRSGCWYLEPAFRVHGEPAIRYVRGRFQGWGYLDLERCLGKPLNEILTPGNAILSTLHHPIAGPMSNVFIAGTFKGKLCDWDGDGKIDLNSRNVYSTVNGELDLDQDGVADRPGLTCCSRRSNLM
jgi:HEAT repeats